MSGLDDDILRDLPIEIWTESDIGQWLLALAKEGRCKYTRLNATFGRFEAIEEPESSMVGEYRADYSELSGEEIAATDPELDELYANSSPIVLK